MTAMLRGYSIEQRRAGQGAGASGDQQTSNHACRHDDGRGAAGFARIVEGEIIPRLLMAHRGDTQADDPIRDSATDAIQFDIDKFTRLAIAEEAHVVLAEVDALMTRGASVDTICIDLLAPVARRLGWMWEEDHCDFVAVTMGLWRLQEVVHAVSARAPVTHPGLSPERNALFTVPPGDQHGFGSIIVEESFRRAGWNTWNAPSTTMDELGALVARRWFDLIGLTITRDHHIREMSALVTGLRSRSRNPALIIMVGGRVFNEQPELVAHIGADGTAPDARQAVLEAEKLLELAETRTASLVAGRA